MSTVATSNIKIVGLQYSDAAAAHRLSAREGWPHRLEDWQFLLDLSTGFSARHNNQIVGTALLTPYGETAASFNMIIVDPAMRGLGLGRRLMERLLDAAGNRECRLIATEAGRPLYEKLGFVATGRIRQHQGVVRTIDTLENVHVASQDDLADLIAFDTSALGYARSALMAKLIDNGTILLLRDESGLHGFASFRRFGRGHIVGPVVARDSDSFKRLLAASIARHRGKPLRIDLTDAAAPSEFSMIEAVGLAHAGGGISMTRPVGRQSGVSNTARIYALASQALC